MSAPAVERIVQDRRGRPEQLVEVLADIQESEGYVSRESMESVAELLDVPLIEVVRVANFYKAFSLTPRGRHLLTVCMGTACHVRGAPRMLEMVAGELGIEPGQTTEDGAFTVESVNCLGACALGPVVVLDDDVHGHMTPARLRRLIESVRQADREGAKA